MKNLNRNSALSVISRHLTGIPGTASDKTGSRRQMTSKPSNQFDLSIPDNYIDLHANIGKKEVVILLLDFLEL